MIPIRDHNPSGIKPRMTQVLIAVNVAVFAYTHLILEGADQDIFLFNWSFIPFRLHFGARLETLVTAMFLHGGWFHLGGNMLFLWIFGDNVEARLGKFGYLAFYLICGVMAGLAQYLHDPFARNTVLGASGAIAGLLGAYLRFYPKARIDVFFFFVIFWKTIPIPAWVVLGFWIAVQTYSGVTDPMLTDGVAYWEHIGGFAAGFLLSLPFRRPTPSEPGLSRSAIPSIPRRP
jgi:membrane associated rhomboid family serine protease